MRKKIATRPNGSRFRRHWTLRPGVVFLNHGSFGACPRAILRLQAEFRRQMEAEPVQFLWRHYEERLEPARAELARFIHARPADVVFVTNATSGVNAVLRSLDLRPGDELLTTSWDYNACRNALVETTVRSGAKLVVAALPFPIQSEDEIVEPIVAAVTKRTKLAMIDHVSSDTAVVLPIRRIVRELAARGVETLVDGAHAPGMLALDLRKIGAAYYTGNLHKWVCAPKGAAFLSVREDRQAKVRPNVISHGPNRPRPGFTPFQDRFDWTGTFDPSAWFCVGEAIRWMGELLTSGWPALQDHNHTLALKARALLCRRLGVEIPCPDHLIGAIATVPLPHRFQGRPRAGKIDAEQLRLYDEFGIEVPLVRIGTNERRCLRVSAQIYNSLAEYDYLADALLKL